MESLMIGMVIGLGISLLVVTIFNIAINDDHTTKTFRPVAYILAGTMIGLILISQYILM